MFQRARTIRFIGIIRPRRPGVMIRTATAKTVGSQSQVRPGEDLLDLWARVKSKMWHFEVQNYQVASWFEKNYHLDVGLLDFDSPRPPAFFTVDMLSAFYHILDQYAGRY